MHSFQGSLDNALAGAIFSSLLVVTINKEYLNISGSWGSGHNYGDLILKSEVLELFKMSVDDIK